MKLIIAGSRDASPGRSYFAIGCAWAMLKNAVPLFSVTSIVSGGATGPDTFGEVLADTYNLPVVRFDADWKAHGKAAGPIRNVTMANYADALIAVWDGQSKGTKHMIEEMKKQGKPVAVYRLDLPPPACELFNVPGKSP